MVAWGPIIGAGISAIGKLFGGGSQKTTNEVDYVKLRDNALKAGFNPLTALRSGGAAGFAVTHHPALSAANMIGDAMSSVGGFLIDYDRNAEQRASQESALLQAQLGLVQAQTERERKSLSFDVPQAQGSRFKTGGGELGTKENPFPTHVWAKDPRYPDQPGFWYVNPDGPDPEQLLSPGANKLSETARQRILDPYTNEIKNNGWYSRRELTQDEKDARAASGWPSWFPTFSVRW